MKRTKYFLMLVVAFTVAMCMSVTLVSCGDDDDNLETTPPTTIPKGHSGQTTNITATVTDEITLTDGYMVFLSLGRSVKGYHISSLAKENFDKKTEAEIISDLKGKGKKEETDGIQHQYTTGLPSGSARVLCCICYDANGNYGPLLTHNFTTKPASSVWDAPCQLTATATEWKLNITKQNGCKRYYMLTNTKAEKIAELVNQPNIILAAHFKKQIADDASFTPKTEDINSTKERSTDETDMFVITWGLNAQNEFSGNISRAYANTKTSTAAPAHAPWHSDSCTNDDYDCFYSDHSLPIDCL